MRSLRLAASHPEIDRTVRSVLRQVLPKAATSAVKAVAKALVRNREGG